MIDLEQRPITDLIEFLDREATLERGVNVSVSQTPEGPEREALVLSLTSFVNDSRSD